MKEKKRKGDSDRLEYVECITRMIEQIESVTILKKIYELTQYYYRQTD